MTLSENRFTHFGVMLDSKRNATELNRRHSQAAQNLGPDSDHSEKQAQRGQGGGLLHNSAKHGEPLGSSGREMRLPSRPSCVVERTDREHSSLFVLCQAAVAVRLE
jgi:hypothetical protein